MSNKKKAQAIAQSQSTKVVCLVCKERIMHGSTKCIHCESPQNWTRFLGIGNVALSLLVALVSVIAATAPTLKDTFAGPFTDIRTGILRVDKKRALILMTSNVGNRPGGLRRIEIEVPTTGTTPQIWPLEIKGELIFEPGDTRSTRLRSPLFLPKLATGTSPTSCRLIVQNVQYDGTLKTETIKFPCETDQNTGKPFYVEES